MNDQYCASKEVSKPLVDQFLSQMGEYTYEVLADQITAKNEVKTRRRQQGEHQIRETLSPSMQYAMDLSKEKGASNWLTVLPLEEHGFSLHKTVYTKVYIVIGKRKLYNIHSCHATTRHT